MAYELEYGTLKVAGGARRRLFSRSLDGIEEVSFDRQAAREAAPIRFDLEGCGVVIRPMGLLLAWIALSRGAILATSNVKEFSRIKGLRIDDWTSGKSPT